MANANKKAKAAGKTRRGTRNNDLKEKQFLLSQLPGKNLKLKDFKKMLGQSCLKSKKKTSKIFQLTYKTFLD